MFGGEGRSCGSGDGRVSMQLHSAGLDDLEVVNKGLAILPSAEVEFHQTA